MEKAAEEGVRAQKAKEKQEHMAALAKTALEKERRAGEDRARVDLDLRKLKPLSKAIDTKLYEQEKPGFLKEKRIKLMEQDRLEEEKLCKEVAQ